MKNKMKEVYICPYSKTKLEYVAEQKTQTETIKEHFINAEGRIFPIIDGIPIFFSSDDLSDDELTAKSEYNNIATFYDNAINWLFDSFQEDEVVVRNKMVDLLEIDRNSRVLEVGCGTARDSIFIAERLGQEGEIHLQDISEEMVRLAEIKINSLELDCKTNVFASSATYLPYENNYFDALYTFGGFNEFSNPAQTLQEFCRVVKTGGKIVFGDENIAPWLDDTEYAEIIKTNNPIFKRTSLPLEHLPENSEETALRWVIGNCFYLIDFKAGKSAPQLNLDLPHKGWRGGTLRTRYFGQLEGVSPETKAKVIETAKSSGLSVHEWLEKNINAIIDN
ncbi:MAG: hypothetical protein BA863_18845 [Desulfovibrio sp. S3730MH75]|nr:MAG: hypothetical protein BA863_18845 [Desulfovibrio sp. S3730MH75]